VTLKRLPQRLYKYRSFNNIALRALTQPKVYYSDPRHFNDPLDCKPTIKVDVDLPSLERLCCKLLQDAGADKKEAANVIHDQHYASTRYGDYETNPCVEKYLKNLLGDEIRRLLYAEMGKKGVLSLSETWKSTLMWSHYADQHRGICIEYDTTQTSHPNMAAVDYRSPRSIQTSELIEWKIQSSPKAKRHVHDTYFFAKSRQWQYEKEWRDIGERCGETDEGLPMTAIYFGLECDPAVITTIVKLFSGDGKVSFFAMHPFKDTFALKRSRVNRDWIEACGIGASVYQDFKGVVLPE
jgi:hypothetical protein